MKLYYSITNRTTKTTTVAINLPQFKFIILLINLFRLIFITMFIELESREHFNNLINTYKVCVVDFYATWCKPCTQLLAALTNSMTTHPLNSRLNTDFVIIKVNVNNHVDLADEHGVDFLPYVLMYKNGVLQDDLITGFSDGTVQDIISKIESLLN